jgi:hypothetical protein
MNAIGADSNDWDKHFKLMADIDLSDYIGAEFNIIGTGYFECPPFGLCYFVSTPFTGTFDGNDHEILNFTYSYTGLYIIGLFGVVDGENAEIKNLRLIDPNVAVDAHAGSLVGYLVNGTITDCYVEGGSITGDRMVGGLIGSTGSTTQISNCHVTGNILGQYDIGGLVGSNYGTVSECYSVVSIMGYDQVGGMVGYNSGSISKCYSTGSISATSYVGGLIGENKGQISNCYSESNISEGSVVGGLVGWNRSTIIGCYSTGSVSGTTDVGGLVGYTSGHVVTSYWDIETSGQANSAGGMGKTTAEMQTASSFIGWGCEPVWTIDEGDDYPRLLWENKSGEVITNPSYWEGNGTETDPYLIYTAEELNTIGLILCCWDKHFLLCADIDLSTFMGTSFNTIGIYSGNPFSGVFDGNGHTISNFTYTSTGIYNIGLFGYVADPNAEIKDLGLVDPNVDGGGGRYIGSLVGQLQDGTISGCCAEGGSVVGRSYYVGGLVARSWGKISNCYSTAGVLGRNLVGGLAGCSYGTISNCYSTAFVSGNNDNVGGLVGWNTGKLSNCYSGGGVIGRIDVGGLVGYNYQGTITKCYSTGIVTMGDYTGGLVGYNEGGEITDSFWDIDTGGRDNGIGTPLPTEQMQMAGTFTDAGWDFVAEVINGPNDIWRMCLDDVNYPLLSWQFNVGDFICPDGVNFFDYSFFASHWAQENCAASNNCDGRDLDLLGSVDIKDLRIFADNWLKGF